jgi:hypothetical protein
MSRMGTAQGGRRSSGRLSSTCTKIELKWVDQLGVGSSYEYLKCTRHWTKEGLRSCPSDKSLTSALDNFEMTNCNVSNSPKVSKAEEPGDHEELSDDEASKFRSALLALLCVANDRTDVQSSAHYSCTRLKTPTVGELRRLKSLMRYMQGTRHAAALFHSDPVEEASKVYSDSD